MKRLLGALLALLLSMCGTPAPAADGDVWLAVPMISYHADRKGYNELNLGLGLMYDAAPGIKVGLGFYKNSYYRKSWHAEMVAQPFAWNKWRFGGMAGMITGYEDTVSLFAAPVASFEERYVAYDIMIIPPASSSFHGLVGLQMRFNLR